MKPRDKFCTHALTTFLGEHVKVIEALQRGESVDDVEAIVGSACHWVESEVELFQWPVVPETFNFLHERESETEQVEQNLQQQ